MQYVMQRAQLTKLDGRRIEDEEQQKGERQKSHRTCRVWSMWSCKLSRNSNCKMNGREVAFKRLQNLQFTDQRSRFVKKISKKCTLNLINYVNEE